MNHSERVLDAINDDLAEIARGIQEERMENYFLDLQEEEDAYFDFLYERWCEENYIYA